MNKETNPTIVKKTVTTKTASETQAFLSGELDDKLNDCEHKPFTRADFIREQKQAKANIVNLGCDIAKKESRLGGEKKDKEGKILVDVNGQSLLYATKYYATLSFMGGSINTEITEEQFSNLKVGSTYFCKGRLQKVKMFVNGGMAELDLPVFSEFVELYKD